MTAPTDLVVLGVWIVGVGFGFFLGRFTSPTATEPPERYVVKRLASLYWQVFDTETMTVVSDAHGSWSNAWNVARALNRRAVENSDG